MNKLVLRNPVLRFKEGRKITFAQLGDKMLYNGNEIVTKEMLDGLPIYRRKNGTYIYSNNKLLSPIQNNVNNPQLKYNPGWISNIGSLALNNVLNIQKFILKLSSQNLKKIITQPKSSVPDINGNKVENSGKRTSLVNNRWVNGILKRNDITDVRATQLMLKDMGFDIGKFGVDGKWGKDTERAYNEYLLKNAPILPTSEQLVLQVTQNIPVVEEVPLAGTDSIQNLLMAMLEATKQGILPATGTYRMNPILPQLNRSDTRWVINDALGKNAYNFTGALRKALRLYLNGEQYNANDLAVFGNLDIFNKYKPGFYKQGGNMLPSRNIVKRFKLQLGNKLPTAPKAEKRFRKNSYNTTKEGNRETTTITSQTFGYNRNWPYFRQPAIILRIIEGGDTAFVETPEHHILTKVLPRTALKSGNIYVEYNPKYDENYSLGGQANTLFNYSINPLEYEILKRRFNTAWNLAK